MVIDRKNLTLLGHMSIILILIVILVLLYFLKHLLDVLFCAKLLGFAIGVMMFIHII